MKFTKKNQNVGNFYGGSNKVVCEEEVQLGAGVQDGNKLEDDGNCDDGLIMINEEEEILVE